MTFEEFELLPFEPGWKHEYFDGHFHRSPRHVSATARLDLAPRPVVSPLPLRPVVPADREELVAGYIAAFSDTIHFCDYPPERIAHFARQDVDHFFDSGRVRRLPASRVAVTVAPGGAERIAGAALIVEGDDARPLLRPLFVVPAWHGRGIATAMVSDAINELWEGGARSLRSSYHPGNEASRGWHRAMGFVEEPDPLLARLYQRQAAQELHRRERIGDLSEDDRRRLRDECDRWERMGDALEAEIRRAGSS